MWSCSEDKIFRVLGVIDDLSLMIVSEMKKS